jgi:PAS domain S-box-containing protein
MNVPLAGRFRYTLAILIAATGVAALLAFPGFFARAPFMPAWGVALTALFVAGVGPAILAEAIIIVATVLLALRPPGGPAAPDPYDWVRLAAWAGIIAAADLMSWRLERAVVQAGERERLLRESETRYRLVLEQASDGIAVAAPDGRFVMVNPRFCEMLRYTEAELLRLPVESVYAPGEQEAAPLAWDEPTRASALVKEHRLRRKDGSTFMAELSIRRTSDHLAQATVRDISERHAALAALRSERDLLDGILATSVAGILVVTPEGRVLFRNSRGEALLGVTQDELRDWFATPPGWRFLTPDGAPMADAERPARRVLASGEPVHDARLVIEREGGARRLFSINAAPLREASRGISAVVLSITDITEAEAARRELRDREEQLERVTSAVPGVVYQYVVGPGEAQRFAFVSRGVETLLGASAEAILADPARAWAMVAPEDRQAMRAAFTRASRTLAPWSFDFRVLGPGGTVRWLRDLASAAGTREPDCVLWSGVIVDITERRRLEDELRQAQKMDSLGRLAGGVAHDFNNLLTLVSGYADMLARELGEGDSRIGPVKEIRRAAERATALTRQLLAVSRRQLLMAREVDLNALVRESEKMIGRLVGENVIVRSAADPGPGMVRADPIQLEQVLHNLAVNAREAMPRGGMLTLESRRITLAAGGREPGAEGVPPGEYLVLQVSDTGVGMSRETQAMIFEPFFTTKPSGEGTGLGLSTVYGIVQQSHGFITVESEPGRGATFRIFLPRLPEGRAAALPPEPAGPGPERRQRRLTVLVVEDDDSVRQLTRRVLDQYGFTVEEARNGLEALELLGREGRRVDVMVSDVVMPGMGGPALIAEVRRRWPVLPVLFLSGYTGDELGDAALKGPHQSFLQKPYSPDALAAALDSLLAGAEPPPPTTGPATAA